MLLALYASLLGRSFRRAFPHWRPWRPILHAPYCGPGGPPRGTRARSELDALCKAHDEEYDRVGASWMHHTRSSLRADVRLLAGLPRALASDVIKPVVRVARELPRSAFDLWSYTTPYGWAGRALGLWK